MSEKEYKINYETMRHYLSAFISKENISNQKNTKHILNILETLPEHLISSLMMLAIKVDEYIPFKEGDFVTFQPTYLIDYDKDIMIKKKLMDSGGNMFGEIINDGSWGSEPFNPYYSVMNVSIFLWKDDKIIRKEIPLQTPKLKLVSKLPNLIQKTYDKNK